MRPTIERESVQSTYSSERHLFQSSKNAQNQIISRRERIQVSSSYFDLDKLVPVSSGLVRQADRLLEDIKQKWKGTVISLYDDVFEAEIQDLTNPHNPDELVTISISELSSSDLELLKPGALFYWHIGYREGEKYPRERFSTIRLRRLLSWTDQELKEAKELAENYANFFATD